MTHIQKHHKEVKITFVGKWFLQNMVWIKGWGIIEGLRNFAEYLESIWNTKEILRYWEDKENSVSSAHSLLLLVGACYWR